jgi:nucleoside-diphosphate-sugar epimerase
MRIFVTGGTGYIGQALCRRLREEGHEVRALVRPTSRVGPLQELGVATFTGDIGDRVSMREGMSGADWVVHAAALLDPGASEERMQAANVSGSDNVASLAYKLGVGRFLSVSSMAYWGGSPDDGSLADETSPPRLPFPTPYSATKYAGEQAIQAWAKQGLKVNTVYPGLVYGPPGKKEGANILLRNLLKGRFPALVGADRKTSWIYLDDVVDGIRRAMGQAPPGRGYLLAGDVATVRELANEVGRLGGVKVPKVDLPVPLVRWLILVGTPFYRMRGRRPPMPAAQTRSLGRHWAFSDRRAREELGFRPRSLGDGLPPTIAYLRAS